MHYHFIFGLQPFDNQKFKIYDPTDLFVFKLNLRSVSKKFFLAKNEKYREKYICIPCKYKNFPLLYKRQKVHSFVPKATKPRSLINVVVLKLTNIRKKYNFPCNNMDLECSCGPPFAFIKLNRFVK